MYTRKHTQRSSPAHERLIVNAKRILIEKGFKQIRLNEPCKNGKIDLAATKDGKTYGVECVTNYNTRKKAGKYLDCFDKLIVCTFEGNKYNIKSDNNFEQIWEIPLKHSIQRANTTIRVSKETKNLLKELKIHPRQSYEEVIKRRVKKNE